MLDTSDKKLAKAVIEYKIERLPMTKSGKGYILMTNKGTALPRPLFAEHVMDALLAGKFFPLLNNRHYNSYGHKFFFRAAIIKAVVQHTSHTTIDRGEGGAFSTYRVRDSAQKEALSQCIIDYIEKVESFSDADLLFFDDLHCYNSTAT